MAGAAATRRLFGAGLFDAGPGGFPSQLREHHRPAAGRPRGPGDEGHAAADAPAPAPHRHQATQRHQTAHHQRATTAAFDASLR